MVKIHTSFLQCSFRHMANQARCFSFKMSVMLNSELVGSPSQSVILFSVGTRAFAFLGMSLLIFQGRLEVFRGSASFQYKTQPCMVKTRGSSCLVLTLSSLCSQLQGSCSRLLSPSLYGSRSVPPSHTLSLPGEVGRGIPGG